MQGKEWVATTFYEHLRKRTRFKRNNVKTLHNRTETFLLGPIIWEIVPDYVKKATVLRNLKWKLNNGIQKTVHAGYAKGSYHKSDFYNMLLKIFMQLILLYLSHIFI